METASDSASPAGRNPKLSLYSLTAREREVLAHIAIGKTTHDIAQVLGIAFKTVACHRHRILEKLRANNAAEMIRIAIELGLVAATEIQPPTEDVGTLYRIYVTACQDFFQEAKKTCALLTPERELPVTFEEWNAMLAQRLAENAAQERYRVAREHLFGAMRPSRLPRVSRKP